jgi:hypothetical protein
MVTSSIYILFIDLPVADRLEAMQRAIILLPDENREVLHTLLHFLRDVAKHADVNQVWEM